MSFIKFAFIGNISTRYINPYNTGILRDLSQLDHCHELLKNGQLDESISLLNQICDRDQTGKIKKILEPWLKIARKRSE